MLARHCVVVASFDENLCLTIRPILMNRDEFRTAFFEFPGTDVFRADVHLADIFLALLPPGFARFTVLEALLRKLRPGVPSVALLSDNCTEKDLSIASGYVDEAYFAGIPESVPNIIIAALQPNSAIDESELASALAAVKMFSCDAGFMNVLRGLPKTACSASPVLILGETGTGKDLCAKALHELSPRRQGPFVPVDCGAIPDHLIENELFGHSRGAYTDARAEYFGLIGHADGGTLFLDEIDSLSLVGQSKLLRFLQEGSYRPLGSPTPRRANVRVISATNACLAAKIESKQFRSDLFYRLNVLTVQLPPLRARKADIGFLLQTFLSEPSDVPTRTALTISDAARVLLESYDWPGNIRELFNAAQKLRSFVTGPVVKPVHVRAVIPVSELDVDTNAQSLARGTLKEMKGQLVSEFERTYVAQLLEQNDGNVSKAARAAGKERKAFSRLMKKYGIPSKNTRALAG